MDAKDVLTAEILLVFCCFTVSGDVVVSESGKPCTYFADSRVSSNQDNLINCTWYRQNACCKRTEVTSVFGGMFPLYGATEECSNQMNYMMCYFCSPEQYRWYNKEVHVCADYCTSVYEHCKTAQYDGKAIGDSYASGEEFCRGQRFAVVEGKSNCFDFDADVFSAATKISCMMHMTVLCWMLAILGT